MATIQKCYVDPTPLEPGRHLLHIDGNRQKPKDYCQWVQDGKGRLEHLALDVNALERSFPLLYPESQDTKRSVVPAKKQVQVAPYFT